MNYTQRDRAPYHPGVSGVWFADLGEHFRCRAQVSALSTETVLSIGL